MNYWKEKIESEDFVLFYHSKDSWSQNDTYTAPNITREKSMNYILIKGLFN